jgi:hypothetical protein
MISFACSTLASTTHTGAPIFRTVAVVQVINPQKTDDCWHISNEQKAKPQTSIAYLARSRKSILRAIRNILVLSVTTRPALGHTQKTHRAF